MYAHIATPKSASIFIGRLREVEKIAIRMATPDRLEYLRTRDFASDMVTPEVMAEVKETLDAEFRRPKDTKYFGETWKI